MGCQLARAPDLAEVGALAASTAAAALLLRYRVLTHIRGHF